jgi:hypothetical protein
MWNQKASTKTYINWNSLVPLEKLPIGNDTYTSAQVNIVHNPGHFVEQSFFPLDELLIH